MALLDRIVKFQTDRRVYTLDVSSLDWPSYNGNSFSHDLVGTLVVQTLKNQFIADLFTENSRALSENLVMGMKKYLLKENIEDLTAAKAKARK